MHDQQNNDSSSDDLGKLKSGTNDTVLAAMFRTILRDLGKGGIQGQGKHNWLDVRIAEYIIRNYRDARTMKERTSLKATTYKELTAPRISWKRLMSGLKIIGIRSFKLILELEHQNGQITTHQQKVIMTSHYDDDEEKPSEDK